jgi:hypothetical protein
MVADAKSPTAVQALAEVHETLSRSLSSEAGPLLGLGTTDQVASAIAPDIEKPLKISGRCGAGLKAVTFASVDGNVVVAASGVAGALLAEGKAKGAKASTAATLAKVVTVVGYASPERWASGKPLVVPFDWALAASPWY